MLKRRIELRSLAYQASVLAVILYERYLVPQTGLEPVTQGFSILCSTIGATAAINVLGVTGGNRTHDRGITTLGLNHLATATPNVSINKQCLILNM